MKTKRTKRHVIDLEERIDSRKIRLKEGDVLKIDGNTEVITGVNYAELVRSGINTIRRNGEAIIELGYYIDTSNGELKNSYAGLHHKKNIPPYKASKDYFRLNEILENAEL